MICATLEHSQWNGSIRCTEFRGEREALERSDVLRPLLPPRDRHYIKLDNVAVDGRGIMSTVRSCNLKHGGVRVTVYWNLGLWGGDVPTQAEIIEICRSIHATCINRPLAPADWPFPIGVAA